MRKSTLPGKSLAKTEGANFHGSEKVYALY